MGRYASQALSSDPEFVKRCVQKNAASLEYASDASRSDPDVVLEAFRCDRSSIRFASTTLREDRAFVLKIVSQWGLALDHVAESLQGDEEILAAAIRQNQE